MCEGTNTKRCMLEKRPWKVLHDMEEWFARRLNNAGLETIWLPDFLSILLKLIRINAEASFAQMTRLTYV